MQYVQKHRLAMYQKAVTMFCIHTLTGAQPYPFWHTALKTTPFLTQKLLKEDHIHPSIRVLQPMWGPPIGFSIQNIQSKNKLYSWIHDYNQVMTAINLILLSTPLVSSCDIEDLIWFVKVCIGHLSELHWFAIRANSLWLVKQTKHGKGNPSCWGCLNGRT